MISRVTKLSDEQYPSLERAAAARGQTPGDLLAKVIDAPRDPHGDPRYFDTDEWFRHLGATEEQIAESARCAREERDEGANAHE